jgi:hypothetical protein
MAEISRRGFMLRSTAGVATAVAGGLVLRRALAAPPPVLGPGIRTSFGTVALIATSRLVLSQVPGTDHRHDPAVGHHGGGEVSADPVASAVHGAWTEAVLVDVVVHNALRSALELSPGQFRVRVEDGGPTVSLYSADRDAGPVEPGSTTAMRIRYLVPPPDRLLSFEFADPGATTPVLMGRLHDGGGKR